MHDNHLVDRARIVLRIMWLALSINLAALVVKFTLGWVTQSAMIRGDAYYTAADALVDVMLLVVLRLARRPPDRTHPYGHAKFEALAVAAVAVMVFVMLEDLGRRLWATWALHAVPQAGNLFVTFLVVTLAVSAALGLYEIFMGRRLRSGALSADGWYTFSGCGLTMLSVLSQFGARAGLSWPDALGASIAFVVLLGAGWVVVRGAWASLTDEARLEADAVAQTALAVPGVLGCHEVRSRGMPDSIHVDLHVQVRADLAVLQAHHLAHQVEGRVMQEHPGVVDVTVHVEPQTVH